MSSRSTDDSPKEMARGLNAILANRDNPPAPAPLPLLAATSIMAASNNPARGKGHSRSNGLRAFAPP